MVGATACSREQDNCNAFDPSLALYCRFWSHKFHSFKMLHTNKIQPEDQPKNQKSISIRMERSQAQT